MHRICRGAPLGSRRDVPLPPGDAPGSATFARPGSRRTVRQPLAASGFGSLAGGCPQCFRVRCARFFAGGSLKRPLVPAPAGDAAPAGFLRGPGVVMPGRSDLDSPGDRIDPGDVDRPIARAKRPVKGAPKRGLVTAGADPPSY